jgi:CheY-like chemotaxis protein
MKKILIVEDDGIVALINKRMVEKIGHEAYCCVSNGREAIKTCQKTNPDIILMDIHLEGDIDGIEAINQIRKFSNTPVIFISANINQEILAKIKAIPFTDYLLKPVELIQLQTALGKLI